MRANSVALFSEDTLPRVLIVEDDPLMRHMLTDHMTQNGYECVAAEDGEQALEKLRQDSGFALVIADRKMPGMDGLSLLRKMRKHAQLYHIPVIFQTSALSPQDISEGIKAGAYYYLTKPYQEDVLLSVVKAALRARRQSESFQRRLARQDEAVIHMTRGEFEVRTPLEAENLAFLLGSAYPYREIAVSGLYELLLNAIEHGNLGIGFEEKSRLLEEGHWEKEIDARLHRSENLQKTVKVVFARNNDQIEVVIADQGPGFDWKPYLEIEPSRATSANGRGIAKANLLCFDQILYHGSGSKVHIIKRTSPATFS